MQPAHRFYNRSGYPQTLSTVTTPRATTGAAPTRAPGGGLAFVTGIVLVSLLSACSANNKPTIQQPQIPKERKENIGRTSLPENHVRPEVQGADRKTIEEVIVSANALSNAPIPLQRYVWEPLDREHYTHAEDNPVKIAAENPVSTFSIDVDTASYANMRRLLNQGQLPRRDAIRVEELINYFHYDYPTPESSEHPFSVSMEMGPSPWHPQHQLLHVGLQGYEVDRRNLPPANLVFLIDVSGSMQSPDKIGLLKASLKLLIRQLRPEDRISIAVYAGAAGQVLAPTSGARKASIMAALERLSAGGSTNGGAGIRLAYALAEEAFSDEGINRIILATDGDFNVGTTDQQALKELVAQKRRSGVSLTVLGFGGGNYNDALMQELAQTGNGNAAYIDSVSEARKVLVEEMSSTLNTIASDVKIQIEFNPAVVQEYRLIGYETRRLNREDFNNDKVDAGDIGAGHTVTALYELSLKGSGNPLIDPLRYGSSDRVPSKPNSNRDIRAAEDPREEIAFLKLRYKRPGETSSVLQTFPLHRSEIKTTLKATSDDYRFSAAIAAFGQILRGARYTQSFTLEDVLSLARNARGNDPFGYRGEFLNLARTAEALETPLLSQQ